MHATPETGAPGRLLVSRVLLVGKGEPDRGGIPSFLNMLRHSDLAEWHEVTFLNVAHHDTPEGGRASWSNLRRTVTDAVAVFRAARGQDLVHVHSALAPAVTVARAGLLALAGRLRGCGVVVHAHGGNVETWLVSPIKLRLVRLAVAPAHRVAACWTIGARVLHETLDGERVVLVDNGVDLGAHSERQRHVPPRVLYVGLLTERKGALDLLAASATLAAEGVEHELWMVGGTPDEGPAAEVPVREAASRAGPQVRLLGSRPPGEMAGAYADADVFCLPSWWEAMPLSVLEAMEQGLPVVASDVGDVGRAVESGRTGYVVPAMAPDRLASALRTLLTDATLRADMGTAGRQRVEQHFSSAVTARQVDAVYAEVLKVCR